MPISNFRTQCRRLGLVAAAAASALLTSNGIAGVNPMLCSKQPSASYQAHQVSGPGLALLTAARYFASAASATAAAEPSPQPRHRDPSQYGQPSSQALRERIARYQVSPPAEQRHASLSTDSHGVCLSD